MVDSVSGLKPFTTVQYTTKDGEHITATKNNGIVTLVGDKNGTRQMPIDDFMKEMANTLPVLEKTPAKDTVEISKPAADVVKADKKSEVKVEEKAAEVKAPAQEAPKAPEVGKKLDVAA